MYNTQKRPTNFQWRLWRRPVFYRFFFVFRSKSSEPHSNCFENKVYPIPQASSVGRGVVRVVRITIVKFITLLCFFALGIQVCKRMKENKIKRKKFKLEHMERVVVCCMMKSTLIKGRDQCKKKNGKTQLIFSVWFAVFYIFRVERSLNFTLAGLIDPFFSVLWVWSWNRRLWLMAADETLDCECLFLRTYR